MHDACAIKRIAGARRFVVPSSSSWLPEACTSLKRMGSFVVTSTREFLILSVVDFLNE